MLMVTPRTNALLTHQIKIDKKNTNKREHTYTNIETKSLKVFHILLFIRHYSCFYLDNVAEIAKS